MQSQEHQQSIFGRYPELRSCEAEMRAALDLLVNVFAAGNKLLVCGNGGSAADCEHFVAELMKGFLWPRKIPASDAEKLKAASDNALFLAEGLQCALPAISLVSQIGLVTAIANDLGSELIFAQQVYGLGRPGDVLLAISTSGASRNVLAAVITAKAFGLGTIALTGGEGGELAWLVDVAIRVPATGVVPIQELHLPVYHWLAIEVEKRFFAESGAPRAIQAAE